VVIQGCTTRVYYISASSLSLCTTRVYYKGGQGCTTRVSATRCKMSWGGIQARWRLQPAKPPGCWQQLLHLLCFYMSTSSRLVHVFGARQPGNRTVHSPILLQPPPTHQEPSGLQVANGVPRKPASHVTSVHTVPTGLLVPHVKLPLVMLGLPGHLVGSVSSGHVHTHIFTCCHSMHLTCTKVGWICRCDWSFNRGDRRLDLRS
jgi:hypothetical protein